MVKQISRQFLIDSCMKAVTVTKRENSLKEKSVSFDKDIEYFISVLGKDLGLKKNTFDSIENVEGKHKQLKILVNNWMKHTVKNCTIFREDLEENIPDAIRENPEIFSSGIDKVYGGVKKEINNICSAIVSIDEVKSANEKVRKIPTFNEEFVFYSTIIPSLGLKKEQFDIFPSSSSKKLELSKIVSSWFEDSKMKCSIVDKSISSAIDKKISGNPMIGGKALSKKVSLNSEIKTLKSCKTKTRPEFAIQAMKNRISLNKKAKRTPTINQDIAFYSFILSDSELKKILALPKNEKKPELEKIVKEWVKKQSCIKPGKMSGGMIIPFIKTDEYYKDLCAKLKALVDRLERVSKTGGMSSFEADYAFYSTFIKSLNMDTFEGKPDLEKSIVLGQLVRKWIDKHAGECKKYLDKQGKKLNISPKRQYLRAIPRSGSNESIASRETIFDENDLY